MPWPDHITGRFCRGVECCREFDIDGRRFILDFELGDVFASDKSPCLPTLFLNGQDFADFHFNLLDGFGMGLYTLIDAGTISGLLGSNLSGNIGSYTASLAVSGNDLVLNVVPEPSGLAMLIAAVLGLGVYCNRRKK
jgi:hypothetical protein